LDPILPPEELEKLKLLHPFLMDSLSPDDSRPLAHNEQFLSPDPSFLYHKKKDLAPPVVHPWAGKPGSAKDEFDYPEEDELQPDTDPREQESTETGMIETAGEERQPLPTSNEAERLDLTLSGFTYWLRRKKPVTPTIETHPPEEIQDKGAKENIFEKENLPEAAKKVKGKKKKKKKKKKKNKQKKVKSSAAKSVRLRNDIISETLADLLATQGHQKEAIAMYHKLSLIYPEKNSFFALKIKKLKNIQL
jgi:hypothetical protein